MNERMNDDDNDSTSICARENPCSVLISYVDVFTELTLTQSLFVHLSLMSIIISINHNFVVYWRYHIADKNPNL